LWLLERGTPVTAGLSITLAVSALLILLARLVMPQIPIKSRAVRLSIPDVALVVGEAPPEVAEEIVREVSEGGVVVSLAARRRS
jgi:hypothetical protein